MTCFCFSAPALLAAESDQLSPRDKALIQSAFDGELEQVKGLIEKGASVDATGPKKRTALIWAAANGHEAIVETLHAAGADVDARDSNDRTALMFAVKGSHAEIVQYLLENGADVNARSKKQGFTALIIAASIGDAGIVSLLLDHGADKSIVELGGYTALDRARQYGHPEVASLLEGEPANDS